MDRISIQSQFGSEEACLGFLEAIRWPGGVRCMDCGSKRISRFSTREGTRKVRRKSGRVDPAALPARYLYQCLSCGRQFSATAGTSLHDSHLPLRKWFYALAVMINARGDVSARQLMRDLKVTYKTAWYLWHRIREAMQPTVFTPEVTSRKLTL